MLIYLYWSFLLHVAASTNAEKAFSKGQWQVNFMQHGLSSQFNSARHYTTWSSSMYISLCIDLFFRHYFDIICTLHLYILFFENATWFYFYYTGPSEDTLPHLTHRHSSQRWLSAHGIIPHCSPVYQMLLCCYDYTVGHTSGKNLVHIFVSICQLVPWCRQNLTCKLNVFFTFYFSTTVQPFSWVGTYLTMVLIWLSTSSIIPGLRASEPTRAWTKVFMPDPGKNQHGFTKNELQPSWLGCFSVELNYLNFLPLHACWFHRSEKLVNSVKR